MAKYPTRPALRKHLEGKGLYGAFLTLWEEFQGSHRIGVAWKMAADRFSEYWEEIRPVDRRRGKRVSAPVPVSGLAPVVPVVEEPGEDEAERAFAAGTISASGLSVPDEVELDEFEGRDADERACIAWVAKWMYVVTPDVRTCPSPMAWSLLIATRRVPEFEAKFWHLMWTKLLPARTGTTTGGVYPRDDERRQMDVFDAVQRAHDSSVGQ